MAEIKSAEASQLKKVLNLLSTNSSTLIKASKVGYIEDSIENEKLIDSLIDNNLAFRTIRGGVRVVPDIKNFVQRVVQNEKNRHLDTDISSKFKVLKLSLSHYFDAVKRQDYEYMNQFFEDIEITIYDVVSSMREAVFKMKIRIDNKFGFVKEIKEKIKENDLALDQIETILNSIKDFEFKSLKELSGDDPKLFNLFCEDFLHYCDIHCDEFTEISQKLRSLMTEFREQEKKAYLIKGFYEYWKNNKDYTIRDYSSDAEIPNSINVVENKIVESYPDLDDYRSAEDIYTILQGIKFDNVIKEKINRKAESFKINSVVENEITREEMERRNIEKNFKSFLQHVIDSKKICSISDYYQNTNIELDYNTWLFSVLSKIDEMDESDLDLLSIDFDGERYYNKFGNFYLRDIRICLKQYQKQI